MSYRATIITPLKAQRDDWLQHCLISGLNQSEPTAMVVVTSPLTPESNLRVIGELKNRYPNLTCFERPTGGTFAHAINAGFQTAGTDRVGLLLSDDWLDPHTIRSCLALDADIVVTGRQAYAADGQTRLWSRIPSRQEFDGMTTLEQQASYLCHFFLFRRESVLAVGGVDPDVGLTGADDYDLPWTLLERGATIDFVEQALYQYRDHEEERLTLRDRVEQTLDLRKILEKHGLAEEEIERLIRAKQRWYGVPVYYALENPDWYLAEYSDEPS